MKFLYRFLMMSNVYKKATPASLILLLLSLALIFYSTIDGLIGVPSDYQQGNSFRIIYIHVPAAWMSLMIYIVMAISSFCYLIWQFKLCYLFTKASASIGVIFTLIALITGGIWGKPTWGTYWAWDARLTSELILFFIYISYLILVNSLHNQKIAAKLSSILCLIGMINIPVIYFSVEWWNTLHQGSTINLFAESKIHSSMLNPLLINALATKLFYFAIVLIHLKNEILIHYGNQKWLIEELQPKKKNV